MQLVAIILILVSAVTHASWNLLGKRKHPTTGLFYLANTAGALLLVPVLVYDHALLPQLPAVIWRLLALTSVCMAIYYSALAAAYRHGDISLTYPLARSSPIIVVTVVTFVLGQGDAISRQCVAGIVMVVGGCFLLPLRSLSACRLSAYLHRSCLFALLAACGTAGYSIIDDRALRVLRASEVLDLGPAHAALLYITLQAWGSSLVTTLLLLPRARPRAELAATLARDWRAALQMGVGIYFTYSLVLVAMAFARNVSYIVAFRQLSIPLGALLGIWLLGEQAHRPKLVGVGVISIGLLLVGLG